MKKNTNEENLAKILKDYSKLVKQFKEQFEVINKDLTIPISKYFENIKEISETFTLIRKRIEEVFKPLLAVIKEIKKEGKQKVIPLIYTYIWAIPPHFSPDELRKLIFMSALNIKIPQEDMDKFFIEYFKKDNFKELWRFFHIWEKHLNEERRKVILDIFTLVSSENINGEIENVYSIVIPTLITQIDGLIVDKLGYRANSREKKEKLEEFFNIFLNKNINDNFSKDYLSTNFEIFAEKFFQESNEAEKERNSFNRHLIMHGNTLNYGTEANFYRLVIILDFIITVLYIEDISLETL